MMSCCHGFSSKEVEVFKGIRVDDHSRIEDSKSSVTVGFTSGESVGGVGGSVHVEEESYLFFFPVHLRFIAKCYLGDDPEIDKFFVIVYHYRHWLSRDWSFSLTRDKFVTIQSQVDGLCCIERGVRQLALYAIDCAGYRIQYVGRAYACLDIGGVENVKTGSRGCRAICQASVGNGALVAHGPMTSFPLENFCLKYKTNDWASMFRFVLEHPDYKVNIKNLRGAIECVGLEDDSTGNIPGFCYLRLIDDRDTITAASVLGAAPLVGDFIKYMVNPKCRWRSGVLYGIDQFVEDKRNMLHVCAGERVGVGRALLTMIALYAVDEFARIGGDVDTCSATRDYEYEFSQISKNLHPISREFLEKNALKIDSISVWFRKSGILLYNNNTCEALAVVMTVAAGLQSSQKSAVKMLAILGDSVVKLLHSVYVIERDGTPLDFSEMNKLATNVHLTNLFNRSGLAKCVGNSGLNTSSKYFATMVEAVIGILYSYEGKNVARKFMIEIGLFVKMDAGFEIGDDVCDLNSSELSRALELRNKKLLFKV